MNQSRQVEQVGGEKGRTEEAREKGERKRGRGRERKREEREKQKRKEQRLPPGRAGGVPRMWVRLWVMEQTMTLTRGCVRRGEWVEDDAEAARAEATSVRTVSRMDRMIASM